MTVDKHTVHLCMEEIVKAGDQAVELWEGEEDSGTSIAIRFAVRTIIHRLEDLLRAST